MSGLATEEKKLSSRQPAADERDLRPELSRTVVRPRRWKAWRRSGSLGTALIAVPMVATFALFSWWPMMRGIVGSFQSTNFVTTAWVGLENFTRVLSDPVLWQAVTNTAYFTLLAALIGFPVPILIATIIAEMRRARQISSVLVFLPVIIPPVVSILLWKTFYSPDASGLFNSVLSWVGIGPLPWLQSSAMAMPSIVLQATWAGVGATTVIYLATLMTIDTQLYEAAEIDGASIARRFWHITLPQLRGLLLLMFLLQLIGTFQVFTEPFLMTNGGPNNATITIMMLIYRYAFINGEFGMATALSLMLAAVLAVLSIAYLLATRRWSRS